MWEVQLGYTTHNDGPQHWELVFRYDGKADDDSMDCECPDCDCQVKCECPPCTCEKDCRCPPCECDCPCPPCDCEEDDCPCPPCDCEVVCQCPPCNCEVLCRCPPCDCPVDHQCADWPNCPCGQFDGDNFEYDEDDETFTAKSTIHICHMRINSRTDERSFQLKWLFRESSLIKCTSTIGTFTNKQLAMVESICANVDIPEKGYGDCQSWVRDALDRIDSEGAADLEEDYEHTLNWIALSRNRCGLCWEQSDSDDEPSSALAEDSDDASGQDSGREDDTNSE